MKRELRELIIMMTDAYKLFHRQMYPTNTITVYSNATARSSNHYKGKNKDEVVVFGTQRLVRVLKDKFQEFFDLPEEEVIAFCKEQLSSFTGTDYDVDHILYLHRLQHLPLVVKSLPEGTKCPIKVPYMTFYNTDRKCFWLTNYIESFISSEIWHFITNATIANEYREIFEKHAMKTVGNIDFVQFQGHDFSSRGDYGWQASTSVGLAHDIAFAGGDNVSSYLDAQYYYDAPQNDWAKMLITQTSVPASEHSVQCAHYDPSKGTELEYLDYLLKKFPTGKLSVVCDGMDYWKFMTIDVPQRKAEIMARDGQVIFRPDSGNIVKIICGEAKDVDHLNHPWDKGQIVRYGGEYYEDLEPSHPKYGVSHHKMKVVPPHVKGSIEVLWEIFGGTETEKGYKLLDSHIGLIYGDSVTLDIADEVCIKLAFNNFASINWVAGIGSYTYQFNTRDSHGQAIKATYIELNMGSDAFDAENGKSDQIVGKPIFKDPKTGDGLKKSAKGLLHVTKNPKTGAYELRDEVQWHTEEAGWLKTILDRGEFRNVTTLEEVRARLRSA